MSTIFTLRPEATRHNIVLYHDYLCPWCWVGLFQAKRLTEELGVTFDWVGAELFPPEMDGPPSNPGPQPVVATDPNKPKNRFELFCEAEQIFLPSPRPGFGRTHNALLAAEWAKSVGVEAFDKLNEAIYRARWERCEDINDIAVLAKLASDLGLDSAALTHSVETNAFVDKIIPFDDPAYNIGVRHVPTFLFGTEELLAEAHYVELKFATERFLLRKPK